MIDHIGLKVADLDRSRRFYEDALRPLGIFVVMVLTRENTGGAYEGIGFGRAGKPSFWISPGDNGASGPLHLALATDRREQVDAFHSTALAAGGRDNGTPGPRPAYHADYYGAFVLDPDGNNIEAVHHGPAMRSTDAVTITLERLG